jgi:hypothetical protein
MTWTTTPRGYKTIIDMGAPNSAEVVGPNHEANARLIAAAPDLLAALEAVTACLRGFHAADDFGPLDDEAIDAALDAISKAQGA